MDARVLLPQDVEACHALIVALTTQEAELSSRLHSQNTLVGEQSRTLGELHEAREQLARENIELQLTIKQLLARLYGRRSERVEDPTQLKLNFQDDPQAAEALVDAAEEAERIVQEYTVRRTLKKQKPRNEQLPDHLPRVEKIVEAEQHEKDCAEHGPKRLIGYDIREKLMFEQPKLWVLRRLYPLYACVDHSDCGVSTPARPEGLVEGDRYDTSIATEIITAKYAYHLPFYRQQDYLASSGWTPSRSTLLNILVASELRLRPFAEYYREWALSSSGVGCDETGVTLIVPSVLPELVAGDPRSERTHEVLQKALENKRPSVTAHMWAYRPFDLPVNVFDFTVSRHRDGPDDVLQDYTGLLMGDCWSGFQKIELRSDARIKRAACWSHARRKLFEGRSSHPQQASVLLALVRELYDIEDRARTFSPEERLALRQRESRPLLTRIRAALDGDARVPVLPKSIFAEAVGYIRNHWDALNVFTTDGRMPIDNNDVEQLMKQVAVGRKNWLFLGSVEAGVRAATLLTIISTALRNDLDVWAYVKDVLDKLLAGCSDYESLRADVWKQSHPEYVRQYRVDERRDQADRQRVHRAERRLQTSGGGEGPERVTEASDGSE
jgi:transposase